jgi:hypothetical protein
MQRIDSGVRLDDQTPPSSKSPSYTLFSRLLQPLEDAVEDAVSGTFLEGICSTPSSSRRSSLSTVQASPSIVPAKRDSREYLSTEIVVYGTLSERELDVEVDTLAVSTLMKEDPQDALWKPFCSESDCPCYDCETYAYAHDLVAASPREYRTKIAKIYRQIGSSSFLLFKFAERLEDAGEVMNHTIQLFLGNLPMSMENFLGDLIQESPVYFARAIAFLHKYTKDCGPYPKKNALRRLYSNETTNATELFSRAFIAIANSDGNKKNALRIIINCLSPREREAIIYTVFVHYQAGKIAKEERDKIEEVSAFYLFGIFKEGQALNRVQEKYFRYRESFRAPESLDPLLYADGIESLLAYDGQVDLKPLFKLMGRTWRRGFASLLNEISNLSSLPVESIDEAISGFFRSFSNAERLLIYTECAKSTSSNVLAHYTGDTPVRVLTPDEEKQFLKEVQVCKDVSEESSSCSHLEPCCNCSLDRNVQMLMTKPSQGLGSLLLDFSEQSGYQNIAIRDLFIRIRESTDYSETEKDQNILTLMGYFPDLYFKELLTDAFEGPSFFFARTFLALCPGISLGCFQSLIMKEGKRWRSSVFRICIGVLESPLEEEQKAKFCKGLFTFFSKAQEEALACYFVRLSEVEISEEMLKKIASFSQEKYFAKLVMELNKDSCEILEHLSLEYKYSLVNSMMKDSDRFIEALLKVQAYEASVSLEEYTIEECAFFFCEVCMKILASDVDSQWKAYSLTLLFDALTEGQQLEFLRYLSDCEHFSSASFDVMADLLDKSECTELLAKLLSNKFYLM